MGQDIYYQVREGVRSERERERERERDVGGGGGVGGGERFHIFHTRHRTKNCYPFLHKILSLLTEQDEFDIDLANPGCHARF